LKKALFTYLLSICICFGYSQNIENIGKQKPFVIHGSMGASGSYYASNEPTATRPPWSWNLYGNFTPVVYGISMPVSFVLNQYGNSYTQPFGQFGISPTYKWATLHLGYRTIQMSPMVFDGQSFRGVGLELKPKLLRFAAFYGKLNRKVNEDTSSGRYSQPQFSRIGYGIKLGIGNDARFFDLIYFHAKDDSSSVKIINKNKIHSQENTVIGSSFKLTFIKKIIWTGDIAISGITDDLSSPKNDSVTSGFAEKFFAKLMPFRTSTSVNIGGQTALNIVLKEYNTTLGYRRVQPNFKSLGTPYMLNDIELINWMNNFNLMQGKLNINTSVSNQHNNLKKDLTSQMNTFVSNLNVNALITQQLNVNLNYSGYLLNQKDGTIALTDSTRLNQQVHQLGLMPSYSIFNSTKSHTISASVNYMLLDDKNPVTAPFTSSNNLSASLNYTLGLSKKGMNFTISGLYNQYIQDTNHYSSYGVNLGSSAQFLKNKNLNVQATAGYMINKSTYANTQSNLTFSGSIGYRKQKHSLSLFANYVYTPYNPINNVIAKALSQVVASKNFMGGLTYNYSF
jgi:hypothetical protein